MPRLLLTLTVALVVIAGCGGGDDSSKNGGGGQALSQQDFVAEANKICRQGSAKINDKAREVQQKLQGKSIGEQQKVVADVLQETAKEYDPYLARLHDLHPPQDISAEWTKFLAGIDKAFELIPDLADATRDGDRDKLSALTTQFSQIAGDTRPFAEKYKLDDCLPDESTS